MNSKDLAKRIAELERQVRELQSRPVYVYVFPVVNPQPVVVPQWVPVSTPYLPPITCGTSVGGIG